MSFDINGNKLQPGHCEVHPHINEDYPCSVCNSEHYRKVASSEQQGKWKAQDELAALSARLNKTIDDKSKHIKELENRIEYLLMQNWQGHHIFKMDGLLDGLKQRDLDLKIQTILSFGKRLGNLTTCNNMSTDIGMAVNHAIKEIQEELSEVPK